MPAVPSERKTSFPTRPPTPGGFAAKPNEADKSVRATSKTPLFIGIGAAAAISIGAFVMFSDGEKAEQSGPLSPLSGTSGPVAANTPPATAPGAAQGTVRTTLNSAATLALKDGITNTLGMKFVPVQGTDVLFCIHEVRYTTTPP